MKNILLQFLNNEKIGFLWFYEQIKDIQNGTMLVLVIIGFDNGLKSEWQVLTQNNADLSSKWYLGNDSCGISGEFWYL